MFCGRAVVGDDDPPPVPVPPVTIAGSAETFQWIRGVARDPSNPTGYFLCESTSIRYFDTETDEVKLFAYGSQFQNLTTLLVSSTGSTVWCSDMANAIRRIGPVVTITGSGLTRQVSSFSPPKSFSFVWDRAPGVERDSAFYLIAISDPNYCRGTVFRFDTTTCEAIRPPQMWRSKQRGEDDRVGELDLTSLACTATGHLMCIGSTERFGGGDFLTFAIDPITGAQEKLEFLNGVQHPPVPLIVIDSTRTFVALPSNQLVTFTLPSLYFPLPKCCDRDL